MTDQFVHLHNHSHYSMLDGHGTVQEMVAEAARLGQTSIALTDHGNMHGVFEFQKAALEKDIEPIFGIEAYAAPINPEGRHNRERVFYGRDSTGERVEGSDDVSGGGTYTHMTLLAKNDEGLHNLFRLTTLSFTEGYYRKPRIDVDLLSKYGKGLIATTGCPSGEIQTRLRLGQYDKAREFAAQMQDIVGKENYFLELMDHDMSIDLERKLIPQLLQLAKELNIPLLATNDSHYAREEDHTSHEHMLAMQTGANMSERSQDEGGTRFAFNGHGYFIKSAAQMALIFGDEDRFPGAMSNTLLVAEMCQGARLKYDPELRPTIELPEGYTAESFLREEAYKGLQKRYGTITKELEDRMELELGVVNPKNYANYFLVTSDFVRWAKNNGVEVGFGRGCLSGDSQIMTPSGFISLRSLQAGDTVFDQNGQPVVIPNKMAYKCEEDLIEIKAYYGGQGNKMTADHKVLVSKAVRETNESKIAQGTKYSEEIAEVQWVRADEVEVGDLVVMPKLNMRDDTRKVLRPPFIDTDEVKIPWVEADADLGKLFGLFISYGCFSDDGHNYVGFDQKRSEDDEVIPHLIKRVLGLEATVEDNETNDSRQYFIHHQGFSMLVARIFADHGHPTTTKHIPDALLRFNDNFRRGLLEGLGHGNGSETLNGQLKYVTSSNTLAQKIHMLLLSLALPSSLDIVNQVDCGLGQEMSNDASTVVYSVSTVHDVNDINADYGFAYDGQYMYCRVYSVAKVPSEGFVYDFTMPTTHSYVTDSFVVHNSAGGSLLAYALDITELDPMRHKLLFERFLNPERDSPPDIDMDFDDINRDRVIDYVTNKYGKDSVAMISTFTKIGVKTGIKDSARILQKPYMDSNKLTKVLPKATAGHEVTFNDIYNPDSPRYEESHDFRELVSALDSQDTIDCARGVEGRIKTTGVHAAGIIISSQSLLDTIPLLMRQKDGAMITQFDYPTCEALGLIKVDFLGLRNLTIIANAVKNIKKLRNEDVSVQDLIHGPMDDARTFKLLQEGRTLGVFQLDSGAIRELLRRMKPTHFDDISAVLALYRPGPMGMNSHNEYADRKNGRVPVHPIHPEFSESLDDILGTTHGLLVYQEQVMQIATRVAGYTLAQADNLRRAMGKKKKSVLDAEYIPFSDGAKAKGYSEEAIKTLWDTLVPFADYGFNLSHAAGYALLSYVTAYLKANYPAEYMSALLTSVADDKDNMTLYLAECRRMGLKVLTPNVNLSVAAAAPIDKNSIVFGMSGVKGVSNAVSDLISHARGSKPFASLNDFLNRVPKEALNKRVLEGLIDAGGFDVFGYTRRGLLTVLPEAARGVNAEKKTESLGQFSLFSVFDDDDEFNSALEVSVPDIAEFPKREKLSRERDVIGLYVSDHPLSGLEKALDINKTNDIAEIKAGQVAAVEGFSDKNSAKTKIAGVLSSLVEKRTKNGDLFAIATIEDLTGSIEVPLWSRTYEKYKSILKTDHVYSLVGVPRVREEGEVPTFNADSLEEIETTHDGKVPLWIKLSAEQISPESLNSLRSVLMRHLGDSPVLLSVRDSGKITMMELPQDLAVQPQELLVSEIHALFGVDSIGRW